MRAGFYGYVAWLVTTIYNNYRPKLYFDNIIIIFNVLILFFLLNIKKARIKELEPRKLTGLDSANFLHAGTIRKIHRILQKRYDYDEGYAKSGTK